MAAAPNEGGAAARFSCRSVGNPIVRRHPSGPSSNVFIRETHRGFFFFLRMSRCADCKHYIKASTHDRCRAHSDCARGPLYFGALCGVCQGLWSRARAFDDDLEDARIAFSLLAEWIEGFRKNSKGRKPGSPYCAEDQEKVEFERLRTFFNKTKRHASGDSSRSSNPSQRVSVI